MKIIIIIITITIIISINVSSVCVRVPEARLLVVHSFIYFVIGTRDPDTTHVYIFPFNFLSGSIRHRCWLIHSCCIFLPVPLDSGRTKGSEERNLSLKKEPPTRSSSTSTTMSEHMQMFHFSFVPLMMVVVIAIVTICPPHIQSRPTVVCGRRKI